MCVGEKTIFRATTKPTLKWSAFIFSCVNSMLGFWLNAQDLEKEIKGQVYVHAGGELSNIQIMRFSDNKGVITDSEGKFVITARFNDSLLVSSIQYKRKVIQISNAILDSGFVPIALEDATIELDEAVVKPYGLSGNLEYDLEKFEVDKVITAATEKLPNVHVKVRKQSERNLYTARTWDFRGTSIKLDPLINAISGRTKMLKKRVARDIKREKYQNIYDQIENSIGVNSLKIPEEKMYEFYYFCEADAKFDSIVNLNVKADIWKFMVLKSEDFRKTMILNENKE